LNKLLIDNAVPLRIKKSGILMHLKMMIVDNKHVLTGSYNWSEEAKKQDNDLIMCLDPCPLVTLYNKKFDEMWGSN
jgi:cardiolipin hydrolase